MKFFNLFAKKEKTKLEKLESRKQIEQKRQKKSSRFLFLVGGISVVVFLVLWAMLAKTKYDNAVAERAQRKDAAKVELDLDNFGLWQSIQEERMDRLDQNISNLNKNMSTNIQDGLNRVTNDLNTSISQMIALNKQNNQAQMEELKKTKEELTTQMTLSQTQTTAYVDRKIKEIKTSGLTQSGEHFEIQSGALSLPSPKNLNSKQSSTVLSNNNTSASPKVVIQNVEEDVVIEEDDIIAKNDLEKSKTDSNKTEETIKFDIPMGMAQATILSGANAPIYNFGNSNDSTANPIFISLDTEITIANNHYLHSQNCMLQGATAGDLSDQRGKIILQKISCTFVNDKTKKTYKVEDKISGWVYGEDGGVGLKGRLITKEGKIIATALPLTFLKTALTYIENKSANTTNIISGESVSSLTGSLATGAKDGGSDVLDKLSDIYIKYLDSLNPVISILPGRKVTVAFAGTTSPLVLKEYKPLNVGIFDTERNGDGEDGYYNYDDIEGEQYYE